MKAPLDHLRSRKKPVSKRVPIALDTDIADAYYDTKERAMAARGKADSRPADVKAQLRAEELEEETEARLQELHTNSAWFLCRSVGVNAYEDLLAAHVPTEEQRKRARKDGQGELGWNPDTFPPAILVACCSYVATPETPDAPETLEPLTEEFVKELFESPDWNQAEVMGLVMGAIEVNSVRRVVDMGNASGQRRRS